MAAQLLSRAFFFFFPRTLAATSLLLAASASFQVVVARAGSVGPAPLLGWQEVDMQLKEPHLFGSGAWSDVDPSAQPWPAAAAPSNSSQEAGVNNCRDAAVDQGTWQPEADIPVQQKLILKSEASLSEEVAKMIWMDFAVRAATSEDAPTGQERHLRPMKASFGSAAEGGKRLHVPTPAAAPLAASLREAVSFGFMPARAGI